MTATKTEIPGKRKKGKFVASAAKILWDFFSLVFLKGIIFFRLPFCRYALVALLQVTSTFLLMRRFIFLFKDSLNNNNVQLHK